MVDKDIVRSQINCYYATGTDWPASVRGGQTGSATCSYRDGFSRARSPLYTTTTDPRLAATGFYRFFECETGSKIATSSYTRRRRAPLPEFSRSDTRAEGDLHSARSSAYGPSICGG